MPLKNLLLPCACYIIKVLPKKNFFIAAPVTVALYCAPQIAIVTFAQFLLKQLVIIS